MLAFLPLQQLGVYNVAYTAFSVFVSIASAIGSSLLPYYGVMYGRGKHSAISEGVRRVSKYTMLLLFPLALGLASTLLSIGFMPLVAVLNLVGLAAVKGVFDSPKPPAFTILLKEICEN
ncbi:MAG: hypothetical protein QXZ66_10925 [Thermoproteota archaeon]